MEVAAKEKHAPAERHHKRLEGFFVDLEDSGTTWTRPSKAISQEEALNLLRDAANNYDAQRERFSNPAKFEDGDLAKELGAWTDKPALPPPTWPDRRRLIFFFTTFYLQYYPGYGSLQTLNLR